MVTLWECTYQLEPTLNSNSCHERQHGAAVVLLRTLKSGFEVVGMSSGFVHHSIALLLGMCLLSSGNGFDILS